MNGIDNTIQDNNSDIDLKESVAIIINMSADFLIDGINFDTYKDNMIKICDAIGLVKSEIKENNEGT